MSAPLSSVPDRVSCNILNITGPFSMEVPEPLDCFMKSASESVPDSDYAAEPDPITKIQPKREIVINDKGEPCVKLITWYYFEEVVEAVKKDDKVDGKAASEEEEKKRKFSIARPRKDDEPPQVHLHLTRRKEEVSKRLDLRFAAPLISKYLGTAIFRVACINKDNLEKIRQWEIITTLQESYSYQCIGLGLIYPKKMNELDLTTKTRRNKLFDRLANSAILRLVRSNGFEHTEGYDKTLVLRKNYFEEHKIKKNMPLYHITERALFIIQTLGKTLAIIALHAAALPLMMGATTAIGFTATYIPLMACLALMAIPNLLLYTITLQETYTALAIIHHLSFDLLKFLGNLILDFTTSPVFATILKVSIAVATTGLLTLAAYSKLKKLLPNYPEQLKTLNDQDQKYAYQSFSDAWNEFAKTKVEDQSLVSIIKTSVEGVVRETVTVTVNDRARLPKASWLHLFILQLAQRNLEESIKSKKIDADEGNRLKDELEVEERNFFMRMCTTKKDRKVFALRNRFDELKTLQEEADRKGEKLRKSVLDEEIVKRKGSLENMDPGIYFRATIEKREECGKGKFKVYLAPDLIAGRLMLYTHFKSALEESSSKKKNVAAVSTTVAAASANASNENDAKHVAAGAAASATSSTSAGPAVASAANLAVEGEVKVADEEAAFDKMLDEVMQLIERAFGTWAPKSQGLDDPLVEDTWKKSLQTAAKELQLNDKELEELLEAATKQRLDEEELKKLMTYAGVPTSRLSDTANWSVHSLFSLAHRLSDEGSNLARRLANYKLLSEYLRIRGCVKRLKSMWAINDLKENEGRLLKIHQAHRVAAQALHPDQIARITSLMRPELSDKIKNEAAILLKCVQEAHTQILKQLEKRPRSQRGHDEGRGEHAASHATSTAPPSDPEINSDTLLVPGAAASTATSTVNAVG